MTGPLDFKVGDRVRHRSAREGFVTKITTSGVEVIFDGNSGYGLYDDQWFRTYPGGLQRISMESGQFDP